MERSVPLNQTNNYFKRGHFEAEVIIWVVRRYSMFGIKCRNALIMLAERALSVAHATMMCWVRQHNPELTKKVKQHLKTSTDSYRVNEMHVKVKSHWKYLCFGVDYNNDGTLDCMLSAKCDKNAAKLFFKKMLRNLHCCSPRKINIDKQKSYPPVFNELQNNMELPEKQNYSNKSMWIIRLGRTPDLSNVALARVSGFNRLVRLEKR